LRRNRRPDPRDVAAALVEFESGATGLLATVRAAPLFWRVHVFGSKQRLRGSTRRDDAHGGADRAKRRTRRFFRRSIPLAVLLEAFCRDGRNRQAVPRSTADMARRRRRLRGDRAFRWRKGGSVKLRRT